MKKKEICKYFLQNNCKKRNNCNYLHIYPDNKQSNINSKKTSTCKFFLNNTCNKSDCGYFHGYCERLQYIKTINTHQKQINNLINMDKNKFISSDNDLFYIRLSWKDDFYAQKIEQGYKIGKLIYFSNNVLLAIEKEGM